MSMMERRLGRSEVIARQGMIATGHPLASAAGLRVLMAGGNAIDAAIATAGVLGVVQPMMSGLGGDTFLLYWDAAGRTLHALNGSGIAPHAASAEWFVSRGHTKMPLRGMLSVSVPGAVDAMVTALERWGSGRFALAELLEPAIEYAADGFPVAPRVAFWIAQAAPVLAKFPSSAAVYLPGGAPPAAGAVLTCPDLAESLRAVAAGGREAFYRGDIARAIAAYMRDHGGLLTERELAEHRSEVHTPIATTYRGWTVYTTAPPSQGVILLEMLNILEGFPSERLRWGTAGAVHLMVEAKKLAVADRNAFLGDPRFVDNPLETLLSKEFAARRRRQIDPDRAVTEPSPGALPEAVGETTYFCVADRWGNAVSYITSLSAGFGCGEIVEGTGVMLNNRAGRGFTLDAGHPNQIAAGKRTMHTLVPYMAFREGVPASDPRNARGSGPALVWGTPGGDGQPQWNTQVFSDIVDNGLALQRAIELPRWFSVPSTDPANLPGPFQLRLERGFPMETLEQLRAMGHDVHELGEMESGGGCQAILVEDGPAPSGAGQRVYRGGSDPRIDGCASGF